MNGPIKPYPYQIRVRDTLLSGKSVFLQAPTGAGKTLAALMPFFEGFCQGTDRTFPKKCLYVVPMRVLANQFLSNFEKYTALYKTRLTRDLQPSILTGERPEDREFASDVIFCTVDQFLSSYACMPYSLSNRKANINAGALTGSYIVLDEFHLLDPSPTLASVWHAIKRLSKVAPVLVMTATFSEKMLSDFAAALQAEVITVSREEAQAIENRTQHAIPRQRIWQTAGSPLSAEAILNEHQRRSLVLCNTVDRAQELYRALKTSIQARNLSIDVILLHSRFLQEDRRRIEQDLHNRFGAGAVGEGSVIAVATQTIEVGVDITSEVLHTELAPASALIQRAGRCARYPGEQGRVIVYPVDNFLPYARSEKEMGWGREMSAAFPWLQTNSGQVFDYSREQEFVNAVATARDTKVIEGLFAGQTAHHEMIMKALRGDRQAADSEVLIRDADSCHVLIHPNPDVLLENPKQATGFALQPGTVARLFKAWEQKAQQLDLEWSVKILIDPPVDRHEENRSEYIWKAVFDQNLVKAAREIVVHPALAGYSPCEGFLPYTGNTGFCSTLPEAAVQEARQEYGYQLESYEEHVERVLSAFHAEALPELVFPAGALERAAKWKPGAIVEAARLACLMHDVGKLSVGWQGWARAHQRAIGSPVAPGFAVAHTDTKFTDPERKEAAKSALRKHPKPNHAAESALAVAPILLRLIQPQELAQAAISAILRHHSPFAGECQPFMLEPRASEHIRETVSQVVPGTIPAVDLTGMITNQPTSKQLLPLLVKPEQDFAWLAYTLLVRALRKADQIGTSYGNS